MPKSLLAGQSVTKIRILKLNHKKLNCAFTLAEVLITLAIIGVVAAITIPALMNRTQDKEFKTKMKKEYSVLSEAFQSLKNDYGDSIIDAFADCPHPEAPDRCLKDTFKQKLSYWQECETDNFPEGVCVVPYTDITRLNGDAHGGLYFDGSESTLNLNDGSSVTFVGNSLTCQWALNASTYTNACGMAVLDVNGLKKPNTIGKDIYLFFIMADVLRPASVSSLETSVTGGSDDCNTGTNRGYSCASKYLSD